VSKEENISLEEKAEIEALLNKLDAEVIEENEEHKFYMLFLKVIAGTISRINCDKLKCLSKYCLDLISNQKLRED
jgi:hypothetical protein